MFIVFLLVLVFVLDRFSFLADMFLVAELKYIHLENLIMKYFITHLVTFSIVLHFR